jgi:hypothetical protein
VKDLTDMARSRDLPQLGAGEELWLIEDIRVADSALVLEVVAMEAADQDVIRQRKDVSKLLITDGVCHGVESVNGISITAKTTIIATSP